MSDVFDTWKQLSFGGIEFPFTDITIRGSQRFHLHEYIKRPGGEVEKLARKAYEISVRCEFIDTIVPIHSFSRYVDLYPGKLSRLLSLCEEGNTQDLFLPPMGKSLRCKATNWTRSITAAKRSGEAVEFSFLEDSTEAFQVQNIIGAQSAAIWPQTVSVQTEVEALNDVNAKDALDRLMDSVTKWLDTVDRLNDEFEYQTARIDEVVARCSALAAVPALGTTAAATANRALVRLWATAVRVRDSQASASRPLLGFLVPRAGMSIVDVSFALYQSPANVVDLLRLNMLDDAMSLPKNLPIRYRAAA
jgi:hypothetical protein